MYTGSGSLPHHVYCLVDRAHTRGGLEGFEPCVWFGLRSYPARAWGCHVMLECGAVVRDLPLHALVRFSLATGVRLSNAIRLTWPQVDFDAGVIRLMVKSRTPGGQVHYVPLVPQLVALLSAERGRHAVYVFTYEVVRGRGERKRSTRHPYTQTGWRKAWGRALTAAGIEDFRWHDLRHTAATRTLRASQNLKVVQSLLGHKDIATTARYAHAMLDDVAAAMAATMSRNSPEGVKAKNTKSLKTKA